MTSSLQDLASSPGRTRRRGAGVTLALPSAVLALLSTTALGQPKAKPVCGGNALPLAIGNQWTYQSVPSPTPPDANQVRLAPRPPQKIVVTVVGADTKDGLTTVKLEEDIDGRKLETSITCGAGKFDISMDSLFFAGEPGGAFGLELSELTRKSTSWLFAGTKLAPEWREDIVSQWKSVPTAGTSPRLPSGKLELERRYTLSPEVEVVNVPMMTFDGKRLTLETTGRITLAGADKSYEMPANWFSQFWMVDGVGPAQIANSHMHVYALVNATIAK